MLVYRRTKKTTSTSRKEILKENGARLKPISGSITVNFMHSSYYGKVAIYSEYCKEQFVADSVFDRQSQTFLCFLLLRCRSREMAATSSLGSRTLPWFVLHNTAAVSWHKERTVKFVKTTRNAAVIQRETSLALSLVHVVGTDGNIYIESDKKT
jgi:hypothetical protein